MPLDFVWFSPHAGRGAVGAVRWALGGERWAASAGRRALGGERWAASAGRLVLGAWCWAQGAGPWALGRGRWAVGAGPWAPGAGRAGILSHVRNNLDYHVESVQKRTDRRPYERTRLSVRPALRAR